MTTRRLEWVKNWIVQPTEKIYVKLSNMYIIKQLSVFVLSPYHSYVLILLFHPLENTYI